MISQKTQDFIDANGAWTVMAIKLPDGTYTHKPRVDYRLRRLLQVAADTVKKPLSECRVLDLACLEGHYAIEFALHGAETTGIEGRAISVAKCDYARDQLGLKKSTFVQDDVLNLSVEKYGKFDIVICSGILYHLKAVDALKFLKLMSDVCTGVLLIDTFISLQGRESLTVDGKTLRGHSYVEHDPRDTEADRQAKLWASLHHEASFWLTEASLVNHLTDVGFTSVMDILTPTMPGNLRDRKTYLAIKGQRADIKSSDMTDAAPLGPLAEGDNPLMDASQTLRSPIFRLAKSVLPPSVKDTIKPALRAIGVLPKDGTPEFMRKKR